MKFITTLALLALCAFSFAQETGIVVRSELSVVYPQEIYRDGRASLNGFGGFTLDNKALLQGGFMLGYDVRKYKLGAAARFLQGRPLDFGLYVGIKF